MKYQYLKQVEYLLNEYEFDEKYKVMLELEELISEYETDGNISKEELFSLCGSPADYVYNLVTKLGLTREISNFESANQKLTHDDIKVNPVEAESTPSQQTAPSTNQTNTDERSKQNDQNNTDESNNQKVQADDSATDTTKNDKKKNKENKEKPKKSKLSKVLFAIIFTIITILSFIIIGFALFVGMIVLVFIDAQTAISLFLGVILILLAIILYINTLKGIIDSILERQLKLAKILITFILGFIFFNIGITLLNSSLDVISQTISANLYTIQNELASRNVNVGNIDWNNLDFNEYMHLTKEVLVSQFR